MKKTSEFKNKISYTILIAIIVLFLIIYSSFLTKIHNCFDQDGNQNMFWLENSIYFMGARHFGYHLLGVELFKIWKFLGWKKGAMASLQIVSVIFGALGVGVFYLILFKLFNSNKLSIIFSLFFGFSHAYWFFSTEAIPRIPALFFGLLVLYFLLDSKKSGLKNSYLVAVIHSIAAIIDLSCLLFVPVVCIGFLLLSDSRKKGIKLILRYLLLLILIILPIYLFLYITHWGHFSLVEFIKFMTFKTPPSKSSLKATLYTLDRTFIAGKTYTSFFEHKCWNYFKNISMFFTYLILPLLFTFLMFNMQNISKFHVKLFLFLIIWFLIPIPFYYYQKPNCLEYYINLLIPFWIIISMSYYYLIKHIRKMKKNLFIDGALLIFLILFMAHNFIFSIYPRSKIENSDFYTHYNVINEYMKQVKEESSLSIVFGFRGAPELAIYEMDKMLGKFDEKIVPIGDMGSDVREWKFYKNLIAKSKEYKNINIFFILCSPHGYDFKKLKSTVKKEVLNNGRRISKNFIATLASFTKTAGDKEKRIRRFQDYLERLSGHYDFNLDFSKRADVIILQLYNSKLSFN